MLSALPDHGSVHGALVIVIVVSVLLFIERGQKLGFTFTVSVLFQEPPSKGSDKKKQKGSGSSGKRPK